MQISILFFALFGLLLSSCTQTETYAEPQPGVPTATIFDSYKSNSSGIKGSVFTVSNIDGKRDTVSPYTFIPGGGLGTHLRDNVSRKAPAGQRLLTLSAYDVYGADGVALLDFTKNKTAKGDVYVNLRPGHSYIVKGEVGRQRSSVWLEDKTSGKLVGRKVYSN